MTGIELPRSWKRHPSSFTGEETKVRFHKSSSSPFLSIYLSIFLSILLPVFFFWFCVCVCVLFRYKKQFSKIFDVCSASHGALFAPRLLHNRLPLSFFRSLSLSLSVYVTDNIKYFANSPRRWPYSALAPILDSKLKVSILRRPVRVRTWTAGCQQKDGT